MIERKVNEITFGLYDSGFIDGQYAMISSIENLGLIKSEMADLLRGVLSGHIEFKDYFSDKGARIKVDEATKEIMNL